MGLFDKVRRQLLKVIECKDMGKDTVVYKYPLTDRDEIMNSSTLVVRPSQCALFIHKGQIADIFSEGTYKLASENIPIITKMLSLPTDFESPIKADVYFVNMKQFTGQKWGTQNPIPMRDKEFGNIRLRGFGVYTYKVDDAKLFMREMFGTTEVYKTSEVAEQIKPMILQGIADAIGESKISALDLAANYKEFGEQVVESSKNDFAAFGLKLCKVVFENISFPEEVEKALDERTKLGVLEDKMGTYTQYQAANAMRDAANNPSGGNLAGLGVGLGAGGAIGNMFANSLSTQNKPKAPSATCVKCGTAIKAHAKFCPECGARQGAVCPKCGASVSKSAKFCPECGTSLVKKCSKCGAELKGKAKFCPECGEKIVNE